MQTRTFTTYSEEETIALGEEFARKLRSGNIVALNGDLGTGKTRFVKGICRGLGVKEHVASPTFTIVTEYNGSSVNVFHFDFYRIKSLIEVREIGVEEYLRGDSICLIEWADRIKQILPLNRFDVHLLWGKDEHSRLITIEEQVGIAA